VLDAHQGRNHYVPVSVSGTPTSGQIATYKQDLVVDIGGIDAPVVGDAWETTTSTYHLAGHPFDRVRRLGVPVHLRFLVGRRAGVLDHAEQQDRVHNLRTWLRLVMHRRAATNTAH